MQSGARRGPPGWSLVVAWGLVGAVGAPVLGLTFLAWAWRGTRPGWLLPTLLSVEVIAALALVVVGRGLVRGLAGLLARSGAARAAVLVAPGVALSLAWVTGRPPAGAPPGPGKRVAVVGAGAAGMHAAWTLARTGAEVVVFEAAPYVGGHAYSYPFVGDDGTVMPIDTGFMFGAPTAYKEMKALLAWYGIGRTHTALEMAGEVHGVRWATGMDGLDPELHRLHALAAEGHADPSLNLVPTGWWLWWNGFSQEFADTYITPLTSVLFVTTEGLYQVSARFMLNMIEGPVRWLDFRGSAAAWVVEGGSSSYYQALAADLGAEVRTLHPVVAVHREAGRVRVTARGTEGLVDEVFDAAVLAVHADVASRILADKTWYEGLVLDQVRYDASNVVIHTDQAAFLDAPLRRAYTYVQDERTGDGFELHSLPGHAQRAGAVEVSPEPVITLNPAREYEGTRFRRGWRHHRQDLWHLATVLEVLPSLQGAGGVWYAGDWVTVIGHGPAMASGIRAACQIAGEAPRPGLSTSPCLDVVLVDAVPSRGIAEERQEICGERGVFEHLVALACTDQVGP